MLRRLLHALAASLLLTLASLPAHADMTIEIVGGGANRHVIDRPAGLCRRSWRQWRHHPDCAQRLAALGRF